MFGEELIVFDIIGENWTLLITLFCILLFFIKKYSPSFSEIYECLRWGVYSNLVTIVLICASVIVFICILSVFIYILAEDYAWFSSVWHNSAFGSLLIRGSFFFEDVPFMVLKTFKSVASHWDLAGFFFSFILTALRILGIFFSAVIFIFKMAVLSAAFGVFESYYDNLGYVCYEFICFSWGSFTFMMALPPLFFPWFALFVYSVCYWWTLEE